MIVPFAPNSDTLTLAFDVPRLLIPRLVRNAFVSMANGMISTNWPESDGRAGKNPLVPAFRPETRDTAANDAPLVERISTGPKVSFVFNDARILLYEIKPFAGSAKF